MDVVFESNVFAASTSNNVTGSFALGSSTAIVDIDPGNDTGRNTVLLEQKIGTVYVNPKEGLAAIQLMVKGMDIATDSESVQPLDYNFELSLNKAPTVVSNIADTASDEDALYSYDVSGHFDDEDVDDTLTYSAVIENEDGSVSELPSWLTIVGGLLRGTPANGDVGVITVKVTATDSFAASVSDSFELTINNTNDAPTVVTEIVDATTNEGEFYSYDLKAHFTDVDVDDSLTFTTAAHSISTSDITDGVSSSSVSILPTWLSLNDGVISGTPTSQDLGSVEITVTATDGSGQFVSSGFSLRVNDIPDVVVSIADSSTDEDSLYSYSVVDHFQDSDVGDTLTYSVLQVNSDGTTSDLDWLSINATTGELSGVPENDQVGLVELQITATDSHGAYVSDDYALSVINTNDAPTGGVQISGIEKTYQVLTASHDLVDIDGGMGEISYQWLKDGEAIRGATDARLILGGDSYVGSSISVMANYTDGYGTAEAVSSQSTDSITDIVRLQRRPQ